MEYREFRAMSTAILLAAEGSPEAVESGFSQAQASIAAYESRFTRFSEDSELSKLNRSAGEWFEASPEMFEVITQAVCLYKKTGGLFDPGVLAALEYAGYDRSIDLIRSQAIPESPASGRPKRIDFAAMRLDPARHAIWLPAGLRIDLGGIAKGWIAEQAARQLATWVPACAVDAGGDMFLIGTPSGEAAWPVDLEDPADPERTLLTLKAGPGAVVTSSITRRHWKQGSQEQHHLIDPRTQQPAETDWLSVTVLDRMPQMPRFLPKRF
jgi:FAD:protein FMN transferase